MTAEYEVRTEDEDFQARIDELLSSALDDQAKEQRMLVDTVKAARAALGRAEEELTALRVLVTERDRSVVDLLEAKLSGLGTEQTLDHVAKRVEQILQQPPVDEVISPISKRIEALNAKVGELETTLRPIDPTAAIAELAAVIEERMASRIEPVEEHLSAMKRALEAMSEPLARQVDDSAASINEGVRALSAMLDQVRGQLNDDISSIANRVDEMERAVTHKLADVEDSFAGEIVAASESLTETQSSLSAHVTNLQDGVVDLRTELMSAIERSRVELREEVGGALSSGASDLLQRIEEFSNAQQSRFTGLSESLGDALGQPLERLIRDFQIAAAPLGTFPERVESMKSAIDEKMTGVEARVAQLLQEAAQSIDARIDVARSSDEALKSRVAEELQTIRHEVLRDVAELKGTVESTVFELPEGIESKLKAAIEAMDAQLDKTTAAIDVRLNQAEEASTARDEASTLASQERDARVIETVEEIRAALGSVSDSLGSGTTSINETLQLASARLFDRMSRVEDALETRISELQETVSRSPELVEGHLEESKKADKARAATLVVEIRTLAETLINDMTARIESSGSELEAKLAEGTAADIERNSALIGQVQQIAASMEQQGPLITQTVASTLEPYSEEMHRLSDKLRQTNRRITESNSRVEAMHESLIAYLASRDQALERVRDQVLLDLMNEIGEGMKSRDRNRLTDALKEADQRRKDRRDAERWRKLQQGSSEDAATAVARIRDEIQSTHVRQVPAPGAAEDRVPPEAAQVPSAPSVLIPSQPQQPTAEAGTRAAAISEGSDDDDPDLMEKLESLWGEFPDKLEPGSETQAKAKPRRKQPAAKTAAKKARPKQAAKPSPKKAELQVPAARTKATKPRPKDSNPSSAKKARSRANGPDPKSKSGSTQDEADGRSKPRSKRTAAASRPVRGLTATARTKKAAPSRPSITLVPLDPPEEPSSSPQGNGAGTR